MPRWWHEGADWLDKLPATVEDTCNRWRLGLDGPVMHGSNAIVLPVRRGGERLVLRITFPDERTADEIRALRFWAGRGTVHLVEADHAIGASLLERLDGQRKLAQCPLYEAIPVIARLMRRLAVPTPPDASSTASMARDRAGTMPTDWGGLANRSIAPSSTPRWAPPRH